MPIEILMPALSPTMTEGTLAKWFKSEGDAIESGDIIAEIETDKATMEIEASESGTLLKILIKSGSENIAVNTPIAILGEDGEDITIEKLKTPDTDPKPTVLASNTPEKSEQTILPETTSLISVREALRDAIAEEMRLDKNVFLMGEEVAQYEGAYKISQGLLEEFGENRIIDTPITEHGFTGLGVGAALSGLRPIIEFMTFNFAMQAIDQIINSAAKTLYMSGGQMEVPIVFRGANGAASRVGAQHSQCFASWYSHCPGLKVVAPWSSSDAKGLLKAAIRDPNPVIFLENEILYGQDFDMPKTDDFLDTIGKAKIEREGDDVTITAYSIMVGVALEAADRLAEDGISCEVINLRSLRPLDSRALINSVKKTNRIVTVEEGWPTCSINSEIAALIMEHAFDYLDSPIYRINSADVPLPYAANLEKLALPSANDVVKAAKSACYVT